MHVIYTLYAEKSSIKFINIHLCKKTMHTHPYTPAVLCRMKKTLLFPPKRVKFEVTDGNRFRCRGRCPHRPGRMGRFYGTLRQSRGCLTGRCGHRPYKPPYPARRDPGTGNYPRCRTASYNKIAAAFDALRDEMRPRMGILTLKSHASATRRLMPSPSFPMTMAAGPLRSA